MYPAGEKGHVPVAYRNIYCARVRQYIDGLGFGFTAIEQNDYIVLENEDPFYRICAWTYTAIHLRRYTYNIFQWVTRECDLVEFSYICITWTLNCTL